MARNNKDLALHKNLFYDSFHGSSVPVANELTLLQLPVRRGASPWWFR
jgi:hypothetical protein